MGAMYAPELYTGERGSLDQFKIYSNDTITVCSMYTLLLLSVPVGLVASFPYPVAAPALAYRGSPLRGRGRAVYNTIRSAAATPTAVPGYPGCDYLLATFSTISTFMFTGR